MAEGESWYARARRLWREQHAGEQPGSARSLLSSNQIAGPSWDVPIAATCAPSAVCERTCYALNPQSPILWHSTMRAQHQRLADATRDPLGTAQRLAAEVQRRRLPHVTINGAGDLTDATVEMVNALVDLVVVPVWVRSRRPKQAARLKWADNLYLHFSLDANSLNRRDKLLELRPPARLFFTYQGAPGEVINDSHGCALVFAHGYQRALLGPDLPPEVVCPLHDLCDPAMPRESAAGACAQCRRCFDGTLVRQQRAISNARKNHDNP
jgi:hypothetical protein